MKPDATLVTFATGEVFERYAEAMLATAERWFFPGRAQHLVLQTTPIWPLSVRDRHTHILKNRRRIHGSFVFFLDADILFEGPVEDEIVADGVTVTVHPGMDGVPVDELTFERDPFSVAYVPLGSGTTYHPGGILGAPRDIFLDLSKEIDWMCQQDGDRTPIWQDESYLNRILIDHPPALILDERYCAWFNRSVPDARIRALNKTPAEVEWRNNLGREAA